MNTHRLTYASLSGFGIFIALVAALHVLDPGRDPIAITVSEYVLGPWAWILPFAVLGWGLGTLAQALALTTVLPAPRPRTGLVLLTLAGLCVLVVAAYPADPVDPVDPGFTTIDGVIHAGAGILGFTVFALAGPLLTGRVAESTGLRWVRAWRFVPPLGYLIFWATAILDHPLGALFGERSATGLGERIMAVCFLAWQVALVIAARRVPR